MTKTLVIDQPIPVNATVRLGKVSSLGVDSLNLLQLAMTACGLDFFPGTGQMVSSAKGVVHLSQLQEHMDLDMVAKLQKAMVAELQSAYPKELDTRGTSSTILSGILSLQIELPFQHFFPDALVNGTDLSRATHSWLRQNSM